MWRFRRVKKRKRVTSVTKHYLEHKELTRSLVQQRIEHYNQHYKFGFNRIAIKNQRRCWGSCSSLKNLNFNYKLYFLPAHLQDYIVVHELCHLQELNHGEHFWSLVEQKIPNYKEAIQQLKVIDRLGSSVSVLQKVSTEYKLAVDRAGE